jgi:hypothetical protein
MSVVTITPSVYKNLYQTILNWRNSWEFQFKKNDAQHKTYRLKYSLKLALSYATWGKNFWSMIKKRKWIEAEVLYGFQAYSIIK